MKKHFLIFILFLIWLPVLAQQDSVKIEFILITDEISDGENIFIVGNLSKLGEWKPNEVKLNQIDKNKYSKLISLPFDRLIEFKFTKGSWSTEALNEDGSVPTNFKLQVKNDTTVTFVINKWRDEVEKIATGQITGTVDYIENFKTRDELLPRDIIIWLPPDYYLNRDHRYPVLYMHDGQNIVDPNTSFIGIDWQIDETADSLIRENLIEPIIIVGLYNTVNRRAEYSENDTGYAYIDFLVNDVKQLIDKKYRTKSDRFNTAVAGSSMGGLISFMIAWERPDVFAKAACISPALKIRQFDYVDNVVNYDGEKKDIIIYFDNGGVGLEDSLQTGIDEMLYALSEKGYIEGYDYFFFKDKDAGHDESAWAKRSWRFLELFFARENSK